MRHASMVVVVMLGVSVGCNNQPVSQSSAVLARPSEASPAPSTPVQTAPSPLPSRWETTVKVNELDNAKLVTISTNDVVIRCGSKFNGYIIPTLTNLGHMLESDSDHSQTVRYKFDDGRVQRATWSISTSFDALFFPTPLLRELPKHKTITVEYRPEYTTAKTESFDLSGLREAVAAGCPASFSASKKAVKASESE